MLYLSILILLILLMFYYDIGGKQKNKKIFFYLLLVIFIFLTSFEFNVGADDEVYRTTFKSLKFSQFQKDIAAIFKGDTNYMLGWVLLQYSTKYLVNDYILIKIIQAIFVNSVVFIFIKKKALYPFTVIFLYAVFDYLLLNFNIVRQSFAFAFFLLAYHSYDKGSLLKYYIFVTCAVLFHNTAIILYILPLFSIIKFNRRNSFFIIISITVLAFLTISGSGFFSIVSLLEENTSESLSYQINTYYNRYQGGIKEAIALSITMVIMLALDIIVITSALKRSENNRMAPFIIFYLIFFLVQQILPILFRYRVYVDLFMFIILSNELYYYLRKQRYLIKGLILIAIITVFTYSTFSGYFQTEGIRKPYIYQYYPYTTIWSDENYKRI